MIKGKSFYKVLRCVKLRTEDCENTMDSHENNQTTQKRVGGQSLLSYIHNNNGNTHNSNNNNRYTAHKRGNDNNNMNNTHNHNNNNRFTGHKRRSSLTYDEYCAYKKRRKLFPKSHNILTGNADVNDERRTQTFHTLGNVDRTLPKVNNHSLLSQVQISFEKRGIYPDDQERNMSSKSISSVDSVIEDAIEMSDVYHMLENDNI